jgi:hypothetical protein
MNLHKITKKSGAVLAPAIGQDTHDALRQAQKMGAVGHLAGTTLVGIR